MSVTRSHSLSIGIVGLPNAGKSTLFNSLTKNSVPAENFPFTTIDKNVGVVKIPDARLDALEQFYSAEKVVPAAMTFVDIAGLVKGASKGEGLGNQFLSHIREVDVVMYVLRAFKGSKIAHVYDRVDPLADFEIVQSELILKDLETIQKRADEVSKRARASSDAKILEEKALIDRVTEWLNSGKAVVDMALNEDETEFIADLWLLTSKRRMFVLNVREGEDLDARKEWVTQIREAMPAEDQDFILEVDVKMAGEISQMDPAEVEQFIALLDSEPKTTADVVSMGFKRLNLLSFFTGSEKEVNAWSIESGATIKEAAGVIHTDLMEKFITAEVVNVEKMIEAGGMVEAREKGIVRSQGKEYLVQDGDYVIVHVVN